MGYTSRPRKIVSFGRTLNRSPKLFVPAVAGLMPAFAPLPEKTNVWTKATPRGMGRALTVKNLNSQAAGRVASSAGYKGVGESSPRGTGLARASLNWPVPTGLRSLSTLEFMLNRCGATFVDSKLLKRVRADKSDRFVSRAAFARRYGIDSRTAIRFLEGEGVPSKRFRWATPNVNWSTLQQSNCHSSTRGGSIG